MRYTQPNANAERPRHGRAETGSRARQKLGRRDAGDEVPRREVDPYHFFPPFAFTSVILSRGPAEFHAHTIHTVRVVRVRNKPSSKLVARDSRAGFSPLLDFYPTLLLSLFVPLAFSSSSDSPRLSNRLIART